MYNVKGNNSNSKKGIVNCYGRGTCRERERAGLVVMAKDNSCTNGENGENKEVQREKRNSDLRNERPFNVIAVSF